MNDTQFLRRARNKTIPNRQIGRFLGLLLCQSLFTKLRIFSIAKYCLQKVQHHQLGWVIGQRY